MTDIFDCSKRSSIMSRIRSKNTNPEKIVRMLLRAEGFTGYRLNRKDLPGTPDIVFGKRKIAIFVHGCFWHGHNCPKAKIPDTNREKWQEKISRNRSRDSAAVEALRENGWRVAIVWQCAILAKHRDALRKALKDFVESNDAFVELERKSFENSAVNTVSSATRSTGTATQSENMVKAV